MPQLLNDDSPVQVRIGFLHVVVEPAHSSDGEGAGLLGLTGDDEADVDDGRAVGMQMQGVRRDVVRPVVLVHERHPSTDRDGHLHRHKRIVRPDHDGCG